MDTQSQQASFPAATPSLPWWKTLNRTQWYIFAMASMAWVFDCLGQQVFVIARGPAISQLAHNVDAPTAAKFGSYATTIFVLGWAVGGLIFGAIGDRIGRARALAISVLLYGLCTGLSAAATGIPDFFLYRFITGLGVGGVFGLAVALCADSLPDLARPHALGMLQSLSALGNILGGLIAVALGWFMISNGGVGNLWRWLFILGAVPGLLCAVFQFRMKEPEKWVAAREQGRTTGAQFGSYASLFGEARWRKPALFGMLLSVAGVVGLWGIGFFSPELVRPVINKALKAANYPAAEMPGRNMMWIGLNMILQNIGAFLGMLTFTKLTHRHGRKKMFAIAAVCAFITTCAAFKFLSEPWHIFVLIPIMGFFQLALFAGFAIYLPELFPLRLRSTGVGFCYNVGRFVAASGPFTLGIIQAHLAAGASTPDAKLEAFRNAACCVSVIYLLTLVALPFLPETKGQPMPED